MKVELTSRHYGVHEPVKDAEIAGDFGDYAMPIDGPGVHDDYQINEDKLIAALPEGFLPVAASQVLLVVSEDGGGTGQRGLTKFKDWAKYFDAYTLNLVKAEPKPYEKPVVDPFALRMDLCRSLMRDLDGKPIHLEGYDPENPLNRPVEMTTAGAKSRGDWCVKLVPSLDMVSVRADLKSWGMGMYDQAELSPEADPSFRAYIFVRCETGAITSADYRGELRAAIEKALAALGSERAKVH